MSRPYLFIKRLKRRLSTGDKEELCFEPGVNLIVGLPNTGKTKWLQTLDYLLGDKGENPFQGVQEQGLAEKYDIAGAELLIGDDLYSIERRWHEKGSKTKVFVDEKAMTADDFQKFLMEKLNIPLLHYPKGNPMSGQTWPLLSFRSLLRHIYRQQRFWSDIADQQPSDEKHACLLQFLGVAEQLFTEKYGTLIKLKKEVEQLKARRDQYGQTLDELARDILSESILNTGANAETVRQAMVRVTQEIDNLHGRRTELLTGARDRVVSPQERGHISQLGEKRAKILIELADLKHRAKVTGERRDEVYRYRTELANERDRMARAEDAGAILSDLKITHCPACDQPITKTSDDPEHCFLCHQVLQDKPFMEELGATRLQFERERLEGEIKEAGELLEILQRDVDRIMKGIAVAEELLRMLDNELAPTRQAVAALTQEDISAIDMALGELNERQRQIERVSVALGKNRELKDDISAIEREIKSLQSQVDELVSATDFQAAATPFENGMNAYLDAINLLRPKVWRHSSVTIDVSRKDFKIWVGKRDWQAVLGGTDTLYFLMAYHYGLLTLSKIPQCHYPGLSIIDVPGEFSGEAVEDKENFIVEPFITLLAQEEYIGAQLIITGVSFTGLENVHRLTQNHVYAAR